MRRGGPARTRKCCRCSWQWQIFIGNPVRRKERIDMSANHNQLTHVSGTFLIQADGAFLNGAGIDPRREDKNTTVPKSYRDGIGNRVPYVSAQAWRRWLRNTLIEETGWPASELRAIDLSAKGTTNKIAGELNPVDYAEDDIFGYMRAA